MPPPYTMSDFMSAASGFFGATTGASPRIAAHYQTLGPELLDRPMTPENVDLFVGLENAAVFNSSLPATPLDRVAMAMTPFRGTIAHAAAQNAAIGREGFFADNEYAQSALRSLTGGSLAT